MNKPKPFTKEDVLKKYDVEEKDLVYRYLGIIEWICLHGVGHPIPETAEFARQKVLFEDGIDNKDAYMVHGCDGCCEKLKKS